MPNFDPIHELQTKWLKKAWRIRDNPLSSDRDIRQAVTLVDCCQELNVVLANILLKDLEDMTDRIRK